MTGATPDNINHRNLEDRVTAWLQKRQFFVESLTYHDKLTPLMAARMAMCDTLTTLTIRGGSDRIALHKTEDLCLRLEFKTTENNKNMALEALPLARHIEDVAECLYVCRYETGNTVVEGGFWATADRIPPIDKLCIPPRWASTRPVLQRQVANRLRRVFAGVPEVWEMESNPRGSSDPYVLINPRVLNDWVRPWSIMLDSWISNAEIGAEAAKRYVANTTVKSA